MYRATAPGFISQTARHKYNIEITPLDSKAFGCFWFRNKSRWWTQCKALHTAATATVKRLQLVSWSADGTGSRIEA
jgi:hypothetical protein